MKTLSIEEAAASLDRWVTLAAAGEHIHIRKGDTVVELRPALSTQASAPERLAPREALRRLQEEARLTPLEAERYLEEVRQERMAAGNKHPA